MSVAKSVISGTVWTTTSTVVRSFVGLFQVLILTRFVPKEAFGTIAVAAVVIGFTQIFLDLGISSAIMHRQRITKNEYSSLFWTNIVLGIVLTGVCMLASPLVALYYHDDSLIPVVRLLCLGILFGSIGIQHRTVQQKKKRFRFIASVEIISCILTCIVAVTLALCGFGIYSLIFSTLTMSLSGSLIFLIYGLLKDDNIRMHYRFRETRPFLRIGAYSVGSSIMDFISREMDVVFISSNYGMGTVGAYSLCKKIVLMLYGTVNPIVTRVLTPIFAEIQQEKTRVKSLYQILIKLIAWVNFPIYSLIAICSYPILQILYGNAYVEYWYMLSILAFSYGILTISNPVGTLQVAFGRTDVGFYWTIYRIVFTLLIFLVSKPFTIAILLLMLFAFNLVNTLVVWRMQIKVIIGLPLRDYVRSFIRPLAVCSGFLLPLIIFRNGHASFLFCTLVSLLFISIYLFFLYREKDFMEIILRLRNAKKLKNAKN